MREVQGIIHNFRLYMLNIIVNEKSFIWFDFFSILFSYKMQKFLAIPIEFWVWFWCISHTKCATDIV